ncbi:MAG: hypothetical protein HeimC2_27780 [Candidatus Heimdallarchaeota archaeon LC_2]|nr:MAG: hypothetical protein HeimC2_27780 [Candidatus Heimdallarchaeota archaeon LC_2]
MRTSTIAVLIVLAASMIIAPQINSTSDVDSFNIWRPGADGLGCHTLIGSANLPTTGEILFDLPVYAVTPGEAFTVTSWIEGYGADLSGASGNDLIIGYNILDGDNALFTPATVSFGNFPMVAGDSTGDYEQAFVAPMEHGTYYLHSYAVGGDTTFFRYIHDFVKVIVSDGYDTTDVVEDIIRQYVDLAEVGVSAGLKWVETNKTGDEVYKSGQTKGTASVGSLMLDIYEDRVRSSLFMGLNQEDVETPLTLAIGAGDWLVSLKSSDGNGGSFWYEVYYANETSNNGKVPNSFYGGVSGIVSFLARLSRITHDPAYLTVAEEGLTYLINENTAEDTPTGNTYTPVVDGYAWTENRGEDANLTSTRWSKGGPGIGAVFLEVYRMTGNSLYLDVAYGHYLFLSATKDTDTDGDYWLQFVGNPDSFVYLGRWHGIAGIVSFLIDLYQVNEKVEVSNLITSSLSWLTAHADYDTNDGAMFENKLGAGEYQNGWSRGGAGIGSVLIRAHELNSNAGYLNLVYDIYKHYENVAVVLGNGWGFTDSNLATKIYVGMGHGGSGIGLFMLGAYQATGDDMFLEGAQNVALGLDASSFVGANGISWTKSTTDLYVDNYIYYGIGGVAKFFLHYDSMGDYDALQTAVDATNYVLSTGVVDGNGLKFPEKVGITDPLYKTGVLKGAPGNALQFMNLYQRLSTDLPFFGLTANSTYEYLNAAEDAMIWMESVATPVEGGIAWYEALYDNGSIAINDIHGSYYAGAAGVADIYTRLAQATGNQHYMDVAEDAGDFLINSANSTVGFAWTEAYADFTNGTLISTRWTYGTPGIADFMINFYQQTGLQHP